MGATVPLPGAARRAKRICPGCEAPVRQRANRAAVAGVWWHLECAREAGHYPRGPGRPRTERGLGSRQVVVRVSGEQAAELDDAEAREGLSAAEQFRRARFGTNP